MLTIEIDGMVFRADLKGTIGKKLAKGILYEESMLRFIEKLNFDGDCVDVGCFIGTHTVFFNKKLKRGVYAFDKSDTNIFLDHMELNKISDAVLFGFYLLPPERLIDYINDKIGLIKIDVDGSDEIDVLEACKEVIDRDAPHIFIEARTDEKLKQIEKYLINYDNTRVFNATPTYYFKPKKI